MVSHHSAKSSGHRHYGNGDTMVLFFHMILEEPYDKRDSRTIAFEENCLPSPDNCPSVYSPWMIASWIIAPEDNCPLI